MNLNPFDMTGPTFLVFYMVLSTVTILGIRLLQYRMEFGQADQAAAITLYIAPDPYLIAFLNGGRNEVLRVAVLSLIERGLLDAKGNSLAAVHPDAVAKARRPLDKAILTKFGSKGKAKSLCTDSVVLAEADSMGEDLQKSKVLPDDQVREARKKWMIAVVVFLWLVAGIKIMVALQRGRTNILFLIPLAVAVGIIVPIVFRQFRTALGDKVCLQLKEMYTHLKDRRKWLQMGRTTSEFTFLAAVYGMAILPAALAKIVEPLHLRPRKWVGGSGCASSCSSLSVPMSSCSGGSSCSSSGCSGGCGGGCGGCS